MDLGGWASCEPPAAAAQPDLAMLDLEQEYVTEELQDLQGRVLRTLLLHDSPQLLAQLRRLVLGARADEGDRGRSKCLLELAVASLVEQGLVVRQGFGAFTMLSVSDVSLSKAESLAYSQFPDEGQLPLYSSAAAAAGLAGGVSHPCPPSRLNRLNRRHSSPRQFGRMAGIEKAGSGRRSKRSVAEDMSSQLQKKMRMQDGSSSMGGGGAGAACGESGAGLFGSGLAAMSP